MGGRLSTYFFKTNPSKNLKLKINKQENLP